MATNYDEALKNIAFLSTRFQGILELGNDIQAAKQLLDQKKGLEASLEALSKELEEEKAKVSKAKADNKKLDDERKAKEADLVKACKAYEQGVSDYVRKYDLIEKEYEAATAKAKQDSDKIIAAAHDAAAEVKKASDAEVAMNEDKLSRIRTEINNLKSKF
jgi:Skp family chaperone for outer membrane proteins